MKKHPLSYIELSKKNLIHNILQLKKISKKGTKIAVAIKGNAYGHGQNEIAKILEPYVDYFIVNSLDELILLRTISQKQTFILGYVEKSDLAQAIKLNCILSIFSIEQLSEIEKKARQLKIKQEVQLPIDAYLGREGFLIEKLSEFFNKIKECRNTELIGIYAHFANIEDTTSFAHAQKQIDEYRKAIKIAEKFGFNNLQTHISATSGLLVYEKSLGLNNIIRLGIGIYGLWPSIHIKSLYKNKLKLLTVLTWKTKVAELKTLPANYPIGYGLTYKTNKNTKVAVIPQGYADGFNRNMSNNGEVLINGKRCKILGRVAMNMFVVDVSHLARVKEEDEVVILGKQGKEEISAEEIAHRQDTINYEVVTKISSLLPRIVV